MADGSIDPRWGRAQRVAIATVDGEDIRSWQEFDVGWGTAHDSGPEGQHHARTARFLQEHGVQTIVADHMGDGMRQMVDRMGITLRLGASGPARDAVCYPS